MLEGRIHRASLYDRALSADEVRLLAEKAEFINDDVVGRFMPDEKRNHWKHLKSEIKKLRQLDTSEKRELTYAVVPSEPKQPTRLGRDLARHA